MRQPDITKENVLKEAKKLFNTQGYKTTSLSDITQASGYTKGAIYKHFENKEALEVQAFEQMMAAVFAILSQTIQANRNAKDKLFSIFNFFENYINNPFVQGGCPLLNVAIEVDDTNSLLKVKAQNALETFRNSIIKIIQNGKVHQQIKMEVNEVLVATVIIATLEGGIMMSKLKNNNNDIQFVVGYLKSWIEKEILS